MKWQERNEEAELDCRIPLSIFVIKEDQKDLREI